MYTQTLLTQTEQSRPGSGSALGTRAPPQGQQGPAICVLCSSPLEGAGIAGATATGSSSNPRPDQQLTLVGSRAHLKQRGANIAWQVPEHQLRDQKPFGFFCCPMLPPASVGVRHCCWGHPELWHLVQWLSPPCAGTGHLLDGNVSACTFQSKGKDSALPQRALLCKTTTSTPWPPRHGAHCCGPVLGKAAMPPALLSLRQKAQQPCHWSGPSLCLKLRDQDTRAGSFEAEGCAGALLPSEPAPGDESRDRLQPAAPRTYGHLPTAMDSSWSKGPRYTCAYMQTVHHPLTH